MSPGRLWFYGQHSCHAILQNPQRVIYACVMQKHPPFTPPTRCEIQYESREWFDQKFGTDATHQGIAVCAAPLPARCLEEIMTPHPRSRTVLLLDQVTDPHNVGAILRSAAAFNVDALILTDRHAPQESAILAKSASGGLEHTPIIRMTNLAQAIKSLKKGGFWIYGFSEKGPDELSQTQFPERTALVMGAEGKGLRRLTKEHCDALIHLGTSPTFSTLNVSNATAIALYHRFIQSTPRIT